KRLTDIAIRNLKPGPARREVPAGNNLYVVIQPSGRKGFAVRYRYRGAPRKLTLPPGITLAAARRLAADAAYQVAQGADPASAKKTAKIEAVAAKENTVAAICAEYMHREGGKLRTSDQRESIFRRLILPAIGDRQIDDIKRSELVRMLDKIEDRSGPRMADVTLATLRRVFHWHALRSDEFRSVIMRGMARQNAAEHRRSRILDDDELRRLWAATTDGQPFSNFVRFLLFTTARRSEAAGLRWSEVGADGLWTLPTSRSKTKIEIVRPLSKGAQAVLTAQPRIGDYVFTPSAAPLRNFSYPKRKLDTVSGVSGYRLHDLRRTSRSLLSRAGVSPDIAERCLGHTFPAIRATYDR